MNIVLIAEDEKAVRKRLEAMVLCSGVEVSTVIECADGQEAFELIREQKIDVLFTDICMPKMNGIELAQKVNELEEKPFVVAMSGYDSFSYAIEMMRNGAQDYLLKPIESGQVAAVMRKLEAKLQKEENQKQMIRGMQLEQLRTFLVHGGAGRENEYFPCFELMPQTYVIGCSEKRAYRLSEEKGLELEENEGHIVFLADAKWIGYLEKNEMAGLHLGVSAQHKSPWELKRAFAEAIKARKKAFCASLNVVHYRQENTQQENVQRAGAPFVPKEIAQMIGTERVKDAMAQIGKQAADVAHGRLTVELFEETMKELISEIELLYANVLEKDELTSYRFLYRYSDVQAYDASLEKWIAAFYDRISQDYDDYGNRQKIKEAMEYIKKNFAGDLNMAVVSNQFSINYSLFSVLFKEYTGTNFSSYLKDLRIAEAKKLLEQTDLRIAEIGRKVGYENEKHFMKIFKNECGVSAMEYRKNVQYRKIV